MTDKQNSVSFDEFINALEEGIKSKKSDKEIAMSLGMKVKSFVSRKYQVSRNLRIASSEYKVGDKTYVGEVAAQKFSVPLELLNRGDDFKAKTGLTIELVKDGIKLPTTRQSRSSKINYGDLVKKLTNSTQT